MSKMPNKPKPTSGDARALLNSAVAFWEAAERCNREAPPETVPFGGSFSLGAPTITCYAFSIELFLKLLIQQEDGTYPGNEHRLDELHRRLPSDLQARLQEHHAMVGQPTGSDVAYHLQEAAKAFTEWRYVHEHDPLKHNGEGLDADPEALARIVVALRETVREVAPDLISFLDA